MNKFFSWFCQIFLKPIVNFIWIKKVRGLENLPKENFILAANHRSHFDQIITGYVCVPRKFTYLGQVDKYGGFEGFLRDLLYSLAGVIRINRLDPKSRKEAIERALKILEKGYILIMYPEGTRSRTGEFLPAKPGVAKICLRSKKPILPVAIKGTFELMPTGKIFPKFKKIVEINIGKPLYFKEEIALAKNLRGDSPEFGNLCQKMAEKVMGEIKKLCQ